MSPPPTSQRPAESVAVTDEIDSIAAVGRLGVDKMLSRFHGLRATRYDVAQSEYLVPVEVREGPYGRGVFATERIEQGTLTGRFKFDRVICLHPDDVMAFLERLDPEDKEYFLDKAYFCEGHIILDNSIGDLGNHSDDPNIVEDIAVRDILPGEELLEDYRALDKGTPAWYLGLCHEVLDEDKSKFYASLGI